MYFWRCLPLSAPLFFYQKPHPPFGRLVYVGRKNSTSSAKHALIKGSPSSIQCIKPGWSRRHKPRTSPGNIKIFHLKKGGAWSGARPGFKIYFFSKNPEKLKIVLDRTNLSYKVLLTMKQQKLHIDFNINGRSDEMFRHGRAFVWLVE